MFMELRGASPFEVLAFRNAAASLHEWDGDLHQAVAAGTLTDIAAVGKGIAGVIAEFARTGHAQKYDSVRGSYPVTLLQLLQVPGLGVKKVSALYETLGIADLEALERAAATGAVRALPGFGARTEERILRGIGWVRRRQDAPETG